MAEPAPHPRAIIREAVRARLGDPTEGTYPTSVGATVHASRTVPLWPGALPAIILYTRQERIDREVPRGDELPLRRVLTLTAEVFTAGQSADDDADRITAEIEALIVPGDTLGGLVESTYLHELAIDLAGDADEPVVVAEMTWEITYYTVPTIEEPAIPGRIYLKISSPFGADAEPDYVPTDPADLPVGDPIEAPAFRHRYHTR